MKKIFLYSSILLMSNILIGQENLNIDNIPDSLKSNANAVIRYYNQEVKLNSNSDAEYKYAFAISILNKKGKEHLNFYTAYKQSSSKIKDIKIELLDAKGNLIRKIKKKDLEDINYTTHTTISDHRIIFSEITTPNYPVTLKASYTKKTKNTLFLPDWKADTSNKVSIQNSQFQLINETNIPLNFHEQNIDNCEITETVNSKTYSITNLKATKSEKYSSIYNINYPHVSVHSENYSLENHNGQCTTWNCFGNWVYSEFLKDYEHTDNEKFKIAINSKLAQAKNTRDSIKIIYKHLQETTRYIFIGLEDGGYKPLDPDKVHDYKYGDCKALSLYMINLLHAYNLPANYIVIHADSEENQSLNKEKFAGTKGNHVIVQVPTPQDTYWLECTSKLHPFDYVGQFTDNRYGLLVSDSNSKLVKTPTYKIDQNKTISDSQIILDSLGHATVTTTISNHGLAIDSKLRLLQSTDKLIKEYYTESLSHFGDLSIKTSSINLVEDSLLLKELHSYNINHFGEMTNEYILMPTVLNKLNIPKLKRQKNRRSNIYFPRSYRNISSITLTIPDGYEPISIPESITDSNDRYSYKRQSKMKNNSLIITSSFDLYAGDYPSTLFNEIRKEFNKLHKIQSELVTLKMKKT